MKTQIKNTIFAVLLGSIMVGCLPSCKKEEVKQSEVLNKADLKKLEKMTKYISIMFEQKIEDVKFNEEKDIFTFGGTTLKKIEVETLYDRANEYKLIHEK